jgi:glycine hydroxymethyltransferase
MAHYGDPVVDKRGEVIGRVTSCAVGQDGHLLGQAHLKVKYTSEGSQIGIMQGAKGEVGVNVEELTVGDRIGIPTPATVLSRFPQSG